MAPGRIAARFHLGLAAAIVDAGTQLARVLAVETVALSGGVFQNRLVSEAIIAGLEDAGLNVLIHRQVPTNDGGLALGQGCVAAALAQDAGGV